MTLIPRDYTPRGNISLLSCGRYPLTIIQSTSVPAPFVLLKVLQRMRVRTRTLLPIV